MILDIKKEINTIKKMYKETEEYRNEKLIMEPFIDDFIFKFCWSSNALEGNTLSLDDTISFLEYDEVRSGHTFSEYEEAKRLNTAIKNHLSFETQVIDNEWIRNIISDIIGYDNTYRKEDVYIGNQIEAVYYPPNYKKVPGLMTDYIKNINTVYDDLEEIITMVAQKHIEFERIHPFVDGNGRTGRIILNQQLINNGLLPITIEPKSKYRQAFKIYNKNNDISMMKYIICKGLERSLQNILDIGSKYDKAFIEEQPRFQDVQNDQKTNILNMEQKKTDIQKER